MPVTPKTIEQPLMINLNFLGTNHHRDSCHNIITRFHDAMQAQARSNPHVLVRLFDGPGSTPKDNHSEHPIPGSYIYYPDTDKKTQVDASISRDIDDAIKRLTGTLVGDGIENLLFEAILFIENIVKKRANEDDVTINLHGFSRGADACMRMANILDKLYPNIKVNLFLIDQVPGPTKMDDPNSYTIPANVKRFDSILMLHESLPGFDPQDEDRYVFAAPETTKVSIKHYFGEHNRATKLREGQDDRQHATKLAYDDLYRFCIATGSLNHDSSVPAYAIKTSSPNNLLDIEKEDQKGLSKRRRFQLYSEMKQNEASYSNNKKFNTRHILKKYKGSKEAAIFVNQEHKELFQQLYPAVYNWFFVQNSNYSSDTVINELALIEPAFFADSFKAYVGYDSQLPDLLPKPTDIKNYAAPLTGAELISNELTYLMHSLRSTANYYRYHHNKKDKKNDQAEAFIRFVIKEAEFKPADEAIQYITQCIESFRFKTDDVNENNFINYRINSIIPDAASYAEKAIKNIDDCLKTVMKENCLDAEVIEYIDKICFVIEAIANNNELSNIDKYYQIQENIRIIRAKIIPANYKIDNENPKALDFFSRILNQLSDYHVTPKSIANNFVKKLDAYIERNIFWEKIQSIFKKINIPFPARFTPEKDYIAKNLKKNIIELDAKGLGDNIEELSKLFKGAQKSLNELYAGQTGLRVGTLDKTITHAVGTLNFFAGVRKQELSNNSKLTDTPHLSLSR